MTGALEVDVTRRTGGWAATVPDAEAVARRAARCAWRSASGPDHAPAGAEVSIVLANDRLVRQLNRDYRGKDRPTNVLSFAAQDRGGRDRVLLLGDVVLALETIVGEAKRDGKPVPDHLSHLVVHGVLHLLGYDHRDEREAVEMEDLEVRVLAELGISDPYRVPEAPSASA